MSAVPEPAEETATLKAPTGHDKTAPVEKMSVSKVSLKVPMTSLFVQYPIRTPLPHSRPCVCTDCSYPVSESLRASSPCPIHCRAVELALHMIPSVLLLIG